MFATPSIKRTAQMLSILGTVSTSVFMAGCTSEAIDGAVANILSAPLTEAAESVEGLDDLAVTPQTEDDTTLIPTGAGSGSGGGSGSESFLALQRLQPATQFEYSTFADGSTFSALVDFSNTTLEDAGEDSVIISLFTNGGSQFCSYIDQGYFCVGFFSDDSSFEDGAFLDLFTLESNNRGTGSFVICADSTANLSTCISDLFESPTGSSVVTAGLQAAFTNSGQATNHLDVGPEYLHYLAQSEPVIVNQRSTENYSELATKILNAAERASAQ